MSALTMMWSIVFWRNITLIIPGKLKTAITLKEDYMKKNVKSAEKAFISNSQAGLTGMKALMA